MGRKPFKLYGVITPSNWPKGIRRWFCPTRWSTFFIKVLCKASGPNPPNWPKVRGWSCPRRRFQAVAGRIGRGGTINTKCGVYGRTTHKIVDTRVFLIEITIENFKWPVLRNTLVDTQRYIDQQKKGARMLSNIISPQEDGTNSNSNSIGIIKVIWLIFTNYLFQVYKVIW